MYMVNYMEIQNRKRTVVYLQGRVAPIQRPYRREGAVRLSQVQMQGATHLATDLAPLAGLDAGTVRGMLGHSQGGTRGD